MWLNGNTAYMYIFKSGSEISEWQFTNSSEKLEFQRKIYY